MIQSARLLPARNLINLRHAKNRSQAQLASGAGLDRSYIGSIEQANRNVSIDNIERLARAFDVHVRDLFA